jgi:Tol biopolymer transport system component
MRNTIASMFSTFVLALVVLSPDLRAGSYRNGRIAFIQGSDIYTVLPDGSNVLQLTRLGPDKFAESPSWEPDDSQIVYTVRFTDGHRQLWIMNANGGNQHRLLDDPSYGNTAGTFSPDGRSVLFSRCDKSADCGIYRVRIDGTGLTALTKIQPGIVDTSPTYSIDGRKIAFERHEPNASPAIVLMSQDGSNIRPLSLLGAHAQHPTWSPDGSRIAFSCDCDGSGRLEIWLTDHFGDELTSLVDIASMEGMSISSSHRFPSWSPDQNFLAFEDRVDGSEPKILVVNLMKAGRASHSTAQVIVGSQPSWGSAP